MNESIGLKYTLSTNRTYYTVSGIGSCTDSDIVIPSKYNSKPVLEIGDFAFQQCTNLTSVAIPSSVKIIGEHAFKECKNLKDITIPYGVTSIGYGAFYGCSRIVRIEIPDSVVSLGPYAFCYCTNLTSIELPEGIQYIGGLTFAHCKNLAGITIPDSVTNIHKLAFFSCESLTSVEIPYGVTIIGGSAFDGCESLTNVTIPSSVRCIVKEAFGDCKNLTTVCYEGTEEQWKNIEIQWNDSLKKATIFYNSAIYGGLVFTLSEDETSYSVSRLVSNKKTDIAIPSTFNGKPVTEIASSSFYNCTNLTSVTIPASVTSIGKWAFARCNSIKSILIPDSITSIGGDTFYHCDSLTNVVIPSSVTGISDGAFAFCESLLDIAIPESVTNIGGRVFYGCEKLTSVTIASSVTNIGFRAFYGCTSLTNVHYEGTDEEWEKISISNGNKDLIKAYLRGHDLRILAWKKEIERLQQPIPVEEYTDSLVEKPVAIANMQLQDEQLKITFSQEVNSVWIDAFRELYKELSSEYSNLLKEYENKPSHKNVILYVLYIFQVFDIDKHGISALVNHSAMKIPEIKLIINQFVKGIQSVLIKIPEEYAAFKKDKIAQERAERIKVIEYKIQQLEAELQQTATEQSINDMLKGMLSPTTSSDSVIGVSADIVVDDMDSNAVDTAGEDINYSEGLEYKLSEEGTYYIVSGVGTCTDTDIVIPSTYNGKQVISIGYKAFNQSQNITSITIPDGIYISDLAFNDCKSLTSVTIPHGTTRISNYAFSGCTNLARITIPDGVTTIGRCAFLGCSSLANITIPSSVAYITLKAFHGCSSLTDVCYEGTIEQWNSIKIASGNECLANVIITTNSNSLVETAIEPAEEVKGSKGLKCVLSEDGTSYIILGMGDCSDVDVVIPSTYKKKLVTGIGDRAFEQCHSIKSVTIPSSVTSIGFQAFISCDNLANITLEEGLKLIAEQAFAFCTALTDIKLPKGVTNIGSCAFSWCTSLEKVYYSGTRIQWNDISVGDENDDLIGATIICNYTGEGN